MPLESVNVSKGSGARSPCVPVAGGTRKAPSAGVQLPQQERGAALTTPPTKGLSCVNSLGRVPGRSLTRQPSGAAQRQGPFFRICPFTWFTERLTAANGTTRSTRLLGVSINVEGRPESRQIKGRQLYQESVIQQGR